MNIKNFLKLAKQEGIDPIEISVYKNKNSEIGLYQGELESTHISETNSVVARGYFNGKLGSSSTTSLTNEGLLFLINQIKANALINEAAINGEIFKGSKKYARGNVFSEELEKVEISQAINLIKDIEKKIYAFDPRLSDVQVEYSQNYDEKIFENSYGLKIKEKRNNFIISAQVKATDGDSIKSDYDYEYGNDLNTFNVEKFCNDLAAKTLAKLHGTSPWKQKKTYAILAPSVAGSLLGPFLASLSADQIQRRSSLLMDKLGQEIISKKLTIEERPLEKNVLFSKCDDEGVATYKKKLFDRGVLKTYLYNLETAQKGGTTTTGNGYRAGTSIGTDLAYTVVKPGKYSEAELIALDKREGVYVTVIKGLHAGLDPMSGNFSLEAEGFQIVDGKIGKPLGTITIAGNLIKLFKDVTAVANNGTEKLRGIAAPSMRIKSLAFSAQ